MSWRDNRRRGRIWYAHYEMVCRRIKKMIAEADRDNRDLNAAEIALLVFDVWDIRRLHGTRAAARSAMKSMELAIKDTRLSDTSLRPRMADPNSFDMLTNRLFDESGIGMLRYAEESGPNRSPLGEGADWPIEVPVKIEEKEIPF